MSALPPILVSAGGIPYNKEHLDAKDARITALQSRLEETDKRLKAVEAERDEARANHEYFAIQWDERGYALKAAEARVEMNEEQRKLLQENTKKLTAREIIQMIKEDRAEREHSVKWLINEIERKYEL